MCAWRLTRSCTKKYSARKVQFIECVCCDFFVQEILYTIFFVSTSTNDNHRGIFIVSLALSHLLKIEDNRQGHIWTEVWDAEKDVLDWNDTIWQFFRLNGGAEVRGVAVQTNTSSTEGRLTLTLDTYCKYRPTTLALDQSDRLVWLFFEWFEILARTSLTKFWLCVWFTSQLGELTNLKFAA